MKGEPKVAGRKGKAMVNDERLTVKDEGLNSLWLYDNDNVDENRLARTGQQSYG